MRPDFSRNPWRPLAWILGLNLALVLVATITWAVTGKPHGSGSLVYLGALFHPSGRFTMVPIWIVMTAFLYLGFSDRAGRVIGLLSLLVFSGFGYFLFLTSAALAGQ